MTADWHIHPWRECSRDAGADRLADGLGAARQILTEAQRRNCPVVFGGDMKQVRGTWSVLVLNGLLGLFREFHDVNVFAIPGNHDGAADGRSGLDVFDELSNFHLFDAPTVHHAPWDTGMVAYWPWQPTLDGLPAFLAEAKRAKARVLVAHAFLSGAAVGPDAVMLRSRATLEQFGLTGTGEHGLVFDLALFGDVHVRQCLSIPPRFGRGDSRVTRTKGGPAVWYPGSPYCQNWGEQEMDKGALLVDLDAGTVEPLPVQAPRFVVADWTGAATSLTGGVNGLAERFIAVHAGQEGTEQASPWIGDFVRLIVGPQAKPDLLERLREVSGARAFQVVVQREARAERRAEVHAGMGVSTLLRSYVETRPPDGLSKSAVLAAGMRLVGDAK
jgi:hypothetical protein